MADDEALVASGEHELDVALHLLSDGVPLSLLLDLATPPHSDELYREEPAEDTSWLAGAPF
jgi:hypothetical protein